MSIRRNSIALALVLGLGSMPALSPSPAAGAEPLPCLPVNEPMGFSTNPPLAPGGPSSVSFLFPAPGDWLPPEQRIVSRPDGSHAHEFTVESRIGTGGAAWLGTDDYPYTLPDLGTWVLHDSDGQPLARYTVKAASWFASLRGPGRIITAGESFMLTGRVEGWTATGAATPVRGLPVTVAAYLPTGGLDWTTELPTSATGTVSVPIRAISNRQLRVNSSTVGCFTHAGTSARPLDLQVRKRITATPGTTAPAVGRYVQIKGTVYPARSGQPIYLQRWNGTLFETVTPGKTNGEYTFAYRPTSRGKQVLRVYTPYDSWHVSSGSPNVNLTVH